LSLLQQEEDAQLQAALAASRTDPSQDLEAWRVASQSAATSSDDGGLAAAITASAEDAARVADDDLQAALLLSTAPTAQHRPVAVCLDSDSDEDGAVVEVPQASLNGRNGGSSYYAAMGSPEAKRPKMSVGVSSK